MGKFPSRWNTLKVIRIQSRLEQNIRSIKTWFSANINLHPQYVHLAAWMGDTEKLLSRERSDIRKADGHGWTALHLSVWNMHQDTVEALLTLGGLVNVKNKDGKASLHLAAWNNDQTVLRMLLEARAKVSSLDADGWTAMHYAASEGHVECCQILFTEGGSDLSALDKDRWTPMHLAAANGHTLVVLELIKLGALTSSRTNRGETPMQVAKSNNRLKVVRGMKNAGVEY
jgi:ankyrin repeat protein